jgi:hypothetical protein
VQRRRDLAVIKAFDVGQPQQRLLLRFELRKQVRDVL